MSTKRGLVVSSPVSIDAHGAMSARSDIDPQELRFALLFWDKLDYPVNNVLHLASNVDEQFLESAGIMTRTKIELKLNEINSNNMGKIVRDCHVETFKRLDAAERGVWSLASGERSFSFEDAELESQRGALVELHRAIPIPNEDVALQDILEFREKRQAELYALRYHLEGVYLRVQNAGDGALAWNAEVDALEHSIADHIRISREWGIKLNWVSFEAGLNLAGGVFAAAVAVNQGLPIVGALITGAAATITLKGGPALVGRAPSQTPFRYVSRFHEELFPGY